jgi:hypothetical protein
MAQRAADIAERVGLARKHAIAERKLDALTQQEEEAHQVNEDFIDRLAEEVQELKLEASHLSSAEARAGEGAVLRESPAAVLQSVADQLGEIVKEKQHDKEKGCHPFVTKDDVYAIKAAVSRLMDSAPHRKGLAADAQRAAEKAGAAMLYEESCHLFAHEE